MLEKSIYELFKNVCEQNPDKIALQYKKDMEWIPITWKEHQETCKKISKSLMALGIQKGDKVSILSNTRAEWIQTDIGTVSIGAVNVGIYATLLADDCAYIINHSDSVAIILEEQCQLDKIIAVRNDLPTLKHIILIDGEPSGMEGVLTWEEFLAKGEGVSDDEFLARTAEVQPQDVYAIVYTSGTTGTPKGAMLSHENLVFTSWCAQNSLYLEPYFETLLFLPLAHVFAKIVVHLCMRAGLTINIAESIEKTPDNLKEIKPHFFASAPRLYEKAYIKVLSNAQDAGGLKYKIFKWALGVGYAVSKRKQQKTPITGFLAFKHKLANKLVFSKIQAALGGNVVFAVSGAAPLNKDIAEFFHACGVLILEGIGMTENSSYTNVNRFDHYKFGTTGPPGPDVEQKIAEDGEVLFRGKNVMLGYYKSPEETAETIDSDGWLHTGDVGQIDKDGFLRITGRKKDLIITSGGKNISPLRVEKIMETSRYIAQAITHGDQKKYLTGVVTLDQDHLKEWAAQKGISYSTWEELTQHPDVALLINSEIEEKNKSLASYESLKKVIISPNEFTVESGELTPSFKVKRHIVTENYKAQLDALYED
ncbi:MAG: long-chain fatty acid--CoA ligase [Candidatus Aminicenantes bacterium]|jgi:long-chain acyl-CoA synthetase